jgi:alanine racemase
LTALRHNLSEVKRAAGPVQILAVVKANAYGHGAVHVARTLEEAGVAFLGVALIEEGVELRNAGITAPIIVMGGSYRGGYELMVSNRLTPMVFQEEHLQELDEEAKRQGQKVAVHVKVDSGMGRIGVSIEELPGLLGSLRGCGQLEMQGFCSQLASADVQGSEQTLVQMAVFRRGLQCVEDAGLKPKWRHLANSAALLGLPETKNGWDLNLARPGLALYGLRTAEWLGADLTLQPALTWKTGVTHVKVIEVGQKVSYGGTWEAKRRSVIATLPVGYADGYHRSYAGKGYVLIRGQRAPVVGRITMDMCMIDVTDVPGVAMGDEVVLLGAQGSERVSAELMAQWAGTIHYEVLCGVGARVPRVPK